MFYTYLWLREDGTPYYVGKGKGYRAFTGRRHNVNCPKSRDRIILQEWLSEAEALWAEQFLIAFYGRTDLGLGCLRNLTDGGEGVSGWKRRTPVTEKERQRLSAMSKGNKYRLGQTHSAETKGKMRKAKLGKKKSAETLKRMCAAAKKRNEVFTDIQRQHMSEAGKKRFLTEESRQKMSNIGKLGAASRWHPEGKL
jgi:hypothetical protein